MLQQARFSIPGNGVRLPSVSPRPIVQVTLVGQQEGGGRRALSAGEGGGRRALSTGYPDGVLEAGVAGAGAEPQRCGVAETEGNGRCWSVVEQ